MPTTDPTRLKVTLFRRHALSEGPSRNVVSVSSKQKNPQSGASKPKAPKQKTNRGKCLNRRVLNESPHASGPRPSDDQGCQTQRRAQKISSAMSQANIASKEPQRSVVNEGPNPSPPRPCEQPAKCKRQLSHERPRPKLPSRQRVLSYIF